VKGGLLTSLHEIRDQVRRIERMVDQDLDCIEVIARIDGLKAALSDVALLVLHEHITTCVVDAIRAGDAGDELKELTSTVERLARS
jgi:DNA-binding FrmR family transcriptional regulator